MIKSMTGYGRAERHAGDRKIAVEIKSLNSKQLDLSARIPAIYREKEYDIRTLAGKALSRGKIDVFVTVEQPGGMRTASINRELFKVYYEQLQEVASEAGYRIKDEPLAGAILRMPDVMQTETAGVSPEEWATLIETALEAIEAIDAFRAQEGRVLMDDLLQRVDTIEGLMGEIIPFEEERIEALRARLAENIEKLQLTIDRNRFEQEIIYYIEKLDVTEEKVRLKQHCDYFRTVMGETENMGRKLGFIAQEMGREINTMGSKANHAEIQKIVVQMKDELEKIKEQLLNIL